MAPGKLKIPQGTERMKLAGSSIHSFVAKISKLLRQSITHRFCFSHQGYSF